MGGVSKEWPEDAGGEEEQERGDQRNRRTGVKESDTRAEGDGRRVRVGGKENSETGQ